MSSIDLIILGIVSEKPQSAYDIQKDIEYHKLSRWTRISTPSVYKKVIQLKEKGYLSSESVKGKKASQKAIYELTEKGWAYFVRLMDEQASQPLSLILDFNVVISNLNKLDKEKAFELLQKLRKGISEALFSSRQNAEQYSDIPLVGRTIFEQQKMLYLSLLEWIDMFQKDFGEEN